MIINRKEFILYIESIMPGIGADNSVMWSLENEVAKINRPNWFIKLSSPLAVGSKGCYWQWINENCQDHVLCYSSSNAEEWWGFSNYEDAILWLLKYY